LGLFLFWEIIKTVCLVRPVGQRWPQMHAQISSTVILKETKWNEPLGLFGGCSLCAAGPRV